MQRSQGKAAALARLAAAVLVGIALAGGPASAATDAARSREYLEDARSKFEDGNLNAAVIQLKNALQSDPDNLEARLLLGEVYLRVGDGASAEKELRFARKLGAEDERIVVPLARAYLLQRKFQAVLDEAVSGERDAEVEADILIARGNAHVGLGDVDSATRAFEAAIALRPDDPRAKVGMAGVYRAQRKFDEAEAVIDEALLAAPDHMQALLLKGEMRRLKRDFEGALAHFDRAIAVQPTNLPAQLGRASALIDLDRHEEAEEAIDVVAERVPDHPMSNYLIAVLRTKQQDYAAAQSALQKSEKVLLDHLPSLFLLGSVHYAQGHFEQAESYLKKFVAASPRHVAARKLLGASLIRKDDPKAAVDILRPALDASPDDPQLLGLMGNALMRSRQFSEATEHFEKAASLAPASTATQTQLALSRLAVGAPEQAAVGLEGALEKDPEATRPGILLALMHLRSGAFDKAVAAAERLQQRLPDNPLTFNLKGAAYLGLGDVEAARRTFEAALEVQPDYFPAEMNLAQLDLRAGRIDAARERLLGILERRESHVGAMMALAEMAQRAERPDETIEWLEKARALNPEASLPRLRLVNAYIARRQADKALVVAHEVTQLAPRNADALDALGRARLAAGEPEQAVGTYQKLANLVRNSPPVLLRLAQAQNAAKDVSGARSSLKAALEVDPTNTSAAAALVELEMRSGQPEEALKVATAFRDRKPDAAAGDILTGDVYMGQRRYAEAVTAYTQAMEKQTSSPLVLRLYRARWAADDRERALSELGEWVSGNPDDSGAALVLAGGLLNVGRYDEATRRYEALAEQFPENAVILNNLAWLYLTKDDERSVEFAERAHELAPNSPRVADTLGWILVQRGQVERGLELLEEAKDKMPLEPDILFHYAVGLHRAGRSDEAEKFLRNLVSFYGDFSSAAAAQALLDEITGAKGGDTGN